MTGIGVFVSTNGDAAKFILPSRSSNKDRYNCCGLPERLN